MINKINLVLCVFLLLGIYGCAPTPKITKPLVDSQSISQVKLVDLNPIFIDEREDAFKTKGRFLLENKLFQSPIFTSGDLSYDSSLFQVFENMFLKRFGASPNGYKIELKLKAFYHIEKANEFTNVPVFGILAVGADQESHCFLKVEVSLLDKENKYIFHNNYDVDVKEMKSSTEPVEDIAFDMYVKAFNKFANDFTTDISRIKI